MKSQPLYYPGEEPIEVADQIKSLIDALSNEYPDHMLPAKLSPAHDQNAQMMAFMLGYESKNDFFEAYGFGFAASKKSSRNYDTILTDVRSKVQDKTEEATEGTATRVHNLLTKLDEAYPDSNITGFRVQHKKWGEAAAELSKLLGYESSDAFLQAYGYVLEKNAGGRPSKDPTVVLDELRKRYPNGAPVKNVAELSRDNPDLAGRLKTLGNSAQKLFGKSLINHLIEIGIVQTETAVLVDRSRTPKDDQAELSERGAAVLAELKLQYAASPARTHLSAFKKAHPSVNWPALMAYMQRCTPFTGLEALLVHEGVLSKPLSSQEAMEYIVSTLKERLGGKPFEGTYVQLQEAYPDLPYNQVLGRTPKYYLQQCGVLKKSTDELPPALKFSQPTRVIIPRGYTSIDANFFINNPHLQSIVLPDTIQSIDPQAFDKCPDLKAIWLYSLQQYDPDPFPKNVTVYCNAVSYQTTQPLPAYAVRTICDNPVWPCVYVLLFQPIKLWSPWLKKHAKNPIAITKAGAKLLTSGDYPDPAYKARLAKYMLSHIDDMSSAEKCELLSEIETLMPEMAKLLQMALEKLTAIERYSFEFGWSRTQTKLKHYQKQKVDYVYNPAWFRGPVSSIKKLKEKYEARDYCELGKGVAQVIVDNELDEGAKLANIIREFPELRCAFFSLVYFNSVCYSESGYGEVTHVEPVDYAKCEGEHWTQYASVLKKGTYRVDDMRTDVTERIYYVFPYEKEWYSDQYILEDNGTYYICGPVQFEGKQVDKQLEEWCDNVFQQTGLHLESKRK